MYEAAVLRVQQEEVEGAPPGCPPVLATLTHHLHDFKILLPQLHLLVWQVAGNQLTTDTTDTTDTTTPTPKLASGGGSKGARAAEVAAKHKPLSGAEVVEVVHARARCGVPVLQSCMRRLLWHCMQVMLQQLTSWWV